MERETDDAFGILFLDLECAKADGRHCLAISQLDREIGRRHRSAARSSINTL